MKLFLAAPDSGLPSALTALVAQESAMHFFMNDVFAAPASALPSLPTALLSQVSCAKTAPPANVAINAASNMLLIIVFSLGCWPAALEFDRKNPVRSRAHVRPAAPSSAPQRDIPECSHKRPLQLSMHAPNDF